MGNEEYGLQVDRVAELLAQRAKRKMGLPRELRLAGRESAPEPQQADRPSLPNWAELQPLDVSARARAMHEIMMIANGYSWQIAVTHYLMTKGAPYLSDLTMPQLEDLLDRMRGYVDAAETGASLEDYLPAV